MRYWLFLFVIFSVGNIHNTLFSQQDTAFGVVSEPYVLDSMLIDTIDIEKLMVPEKEQIPNQDLVSEKTSITETSNVSIDDVFLRMLDSTLTSCYSNFFCFSTDTSVLNYLDFPADSIPQYSPEIVHERMQSLNALTPMELNYNSLIQSYINSYAVRNRVTVSRALGLSNMYFPMFEEMLAKYELPLELKYLAVVESALRNEAKSHAGAVGLWQFMVATGRYYDLEVTSYIDERRDAYKSTEAACQYLSFLYNKYGNWNMALAAYNSGPGNVNKAIRRSGGKKTYWEIRSFLPRETRGYVPAFIAVNYIMNYSSEHNIYPIEPMKTYFELDTIHIHEKLRFDQIMAFTDITEEELIFLNPTFHRGVLPNDSRVHTLYLPHETVGEFLNNEEKIYAYKKDEEPSPEQYTYVAPAPKGKKITYKVRSGDVLGVIADRYDVGLSQVRNWNNIRGNRIYPGQTLVLYTNNPTGTKSKAKPQETIDPSKYVYHTVRSGDTLWDIAKLYDGVSSKDIEQLNRGVNVKRLKKGQKIKVQAI